jgi:hypothetical protein
MLQTRVSQPRLRDFHAVNRYLALLGALRACETAARLMRTNRLRKESVGGASSPIRPLLHLRNALI